MNEDDYQAALDGFAALLRILGRDPNEEALRRTPQRALEAIIDLATPRSEVADLLSVTFHLPEADEMIAVGPVRFVSVCEHHLLPFTGTAWVGYKPTGNRVVGLSKLPRLVHHFAASPQVQERLTRQITDALDAHLDTAGSACVVRAVHACATMRGAKADGTAMVTSSLTGLFRTDAAARAEFLSIARVAHAQS